MNPATLGDLRRSGYRHRTVKEEIRQNLIRSLEGNQPLLPGIIGYDDTVLPALTNALLAGHDLILLGRRGQAKSRILRALTWFLDPWIPVVRGAPLRDDPLLPRSPDALRIVRECGEETPIDWIPRTERYQEKLATPDVSMADLLGDVDPIRAARRGMSILDEEAIAYGVVPRSNRGIFAINELPDLPPRIQVALLDVMEERDVQIRGFNFRLPLDLLLVFSANPEDYTKRGNLITPLRDRIAAQIHTHYPTTLEDGMEITRLESWVDRAGPDVRVSNLSRELVEEVANAARASEWVDQSSGVSARLTIALLESVVSNAERRALRRGVGHASVRVVDFFRSLSAITGKIELVFEGEREGPEKVATHLIGKAVGAVFDRRFPDFFQASENAESPYGSLARWAKDGGTVVLDDEASEDETLTRLLEVPGLAALMDRYLEPRDAEDRLFGAEMILEGLHQHSVLAKEVLGGQATYSDMVSRMWEDFDDRRGRRP